MKCAKKTIILKIANFNIKVVFTDYKSRLAKEIEKYCSEFILSNNSIKPHIIIAVYPGYKRRTFIVAEKKIRQKKYNFLYFFEEKKKEIITLDHISYDQFLYLLFLVLNKLLKKTSGFFFHASAVVWEDKALVFSGKPESGKSTVVKLLKGVCRPLSDDITLIKKEKKGYYVYQTPFIEKNPIKDKKPTGIPLKAIFFLKKAKFFKLERIDNKQKALKLIINQTHKSSNTSIHLLKFMNQFGGPCYFFFFKKEKKQLIKSLYLNIKKHNND